MAESKRAPQFFTVPRDTRAAQCRSCKAVIYFVELPSGKRMPVDCDVDGGAEPDAWTDGLGVSHFATCAFANQHRQAR